ncbi:MAG: hypothetical protein V4591_11165 [Bdellovibrionota bacterium]
MNQFYQAIRTQKIINGHMAYVNVPPRIHARFGDSIDYFAGEHLQYYEKDDSRHGTSYPPKSNYFKSVTPAKRDYISEIKSEIQTRSTAEYPSFSQLSDEPSAKETAISRYQKFVHDAIHSQSGADSFKKRLEIDEENLTHLSQDIKTEIHQTAKENDKFQEEFLNNYTPGIFGGRVGRILKREKPFNKELAISLAKAKPNSATAKALDNMRIKY